MIGDIGLHFLEPENRQVEVGSSIVLKQQSKGYATEALQAVLVYLFGNWQKQRVIASVDLRNEKSIVLLK